jgi:hypothetical protein
MKTCQSCGKSIPAHLYDEHTSICDALDDDENPANADYYNQQEIFRNQEITEHKRSIGCKNPEDCSVSTGICGQLTFGWGNLDFNGYWEHECEECEKDHHKKEKQ